MTRLMDAKKHVLVLPEGVASGEEGVRHHRFLSLPHPRTGRSSLFLVDPSGRGALFEVQRVDQAGTPRTWFVDQEVVNDGSLLLLTPFDPLFLLISYLSLLSPKFLPYQDLWETVLLQLSILDPSQRTPTDDEKLASTLTEDVGVLSRLGCVEARLKAVCEKREHAELQLFRLSPDLVLQELKRKIDGLVDPEGGIFEQTTTKDAVPKPEEEAAANENEQPKAGKESSETQVAPQQFPTLLHSLVREGCGSDPGFSKEIQREARQRVACSLVGNYLPLATSTLLSKAYPCPNLDTHLTSLQSSSVLSATYHPGRASTSGGGIGSGAGTAGAVAKAKKLASKGSMGVEQLKKVSTKGMKKLDSFFFKQPAPTGAKGVKRKVEE
ncbi:BZ3500_MvSof-1268-A1-R1_Chr1-1g01208 [Microbotryum saponariae]|uniref:Ribonuclease H2 subunit B n=1 Tax=Microbotryum saponariae TaxID=289078 RepID=A0A2X0KTG7_9BASI|nr:BZ3500_MvSof-1268-A1-R1_Chr1-1g01208 [Microbotryum saponariae]SCZ93670.1 BZ3501_MvSof-1269-A2-R1_Chr1-1g00804 [Microbotryum saponariae]